MPVCPWQLLVADKSKELFTAKRGSLYRISFKYETVPEVGLRTHQN